MRGVCRAAVCFGTSVASEINCTFLQAHFSSNIFFLLLGDPLKHYYTAYIAQILTFLTLTLNLTLQLLQLVTSLSFSHFLSVILDCTICRV